MKVEVSSVSKREQPLSETAAAVFVISKEDIRRSGATNIPDLLRMVPGVYVAQINSNTWAITIREFNGRFSNEVLVLVDGRTVYTPTFGGVFWDVLDFPLSDLERIEIIRGPGGSIWGANAVNGVINILTKKAEDTQGNLLIAGGGNLEQGFGTLEHGGEVRENIDYRAFIRYQNESSFNGQNGQTGADSWHELRGAFRVDTQPSSEDEVSIQGDLYTGREHLPAYVLASPTSSGSVPLDAESNLSGGFLQSTWNHTFSARSATTVLASYQRYTRSDILNETSGTLDLDFQNNLSVGEKQHVVWGLNYRYTSADAIGSEFAYLNPAKRQTSLFSGFFQYQVPLAADRFNLTIGTKLEHNPHTGFGIMPTIRLAWVPNDKSTYWAAVSRALRTPADTDLYIQFPLAQFTQPNGTPVLLTLTGNPKLKDEALIAYEAGYRTLIYKNLSVDLALYYNDYSNQITIEPGTPFFEDSPPPPHIVVPSTNQNLLHSHAYGLEIYANWKLTNRWTMSPGYAFERIRQHLDPTSNDFTAANANGEGTPVNSADIRNHIVLTHRLNWDTSIYFTEALQSPRVPSHTRLDTGLNWQWKENLRLSVFGQNLIRESHLEFVDSTGSTRSTLIPRSAYAKIAWSF
jgi:iron complex outermembrane receptor protein